MKHLFLPLIRRLRSCLTLASSLRLRETEKRGQTGICREQKTHNKCGAERKRGGLPFLFFFSWMRCQKVNEKSCKLSWHWTVKGSMKTEAVHSFSPVIQLRLLFYSFLFNPIIGVKIEHVHRKEVHPPDPSHPISPKNPLTPKKNKKTTIFLSRLSSVNKKSLSSHNPCLRSVSSSRFGMISI